MPSEQGSSPSLSRLAGAYRYLWYSDRIEGWLYQTTALAMMELLWLQESRGLRGNIAEIGVHHGCSALALVAASRESETIFAIDLFEKQELNLDGSGKGSAPVFQKHLRTLFPQANVTLITKSSFDIRGSEQENGLVDLRFFSIDGSHTKAATLNDLAVADACLAPHGVVCVDDLFNAQWTGVVSALFAFLGQNSGLVPFAFFPNKMFLCRREFRDFYLTSCRRIFGFSMFRQDAEFQEHIIDVYWETWPRLTERLATPEVAAAALEHKLPIDESATPVMRPWLVKPGDMGAANQMLKHMQREVEKERRRSDEMERLANAAVMARAQPAAPAMEPSWTRRVADLWSRRAR
jgi:hypothetical protein